MKKIISIISILALTGTLMLGCNSKEEALVKKMGLNLSEGESFNIDCNADINSTIKVDGQEIKMPMKMEVGTTLDVKSVDKESVSFDYSFNRQKINMTMLGQSMEIDTEANTPEGKEMKELLNSMNISIVIDKDGKVKEFKYPDGVEIDEEIKKSIESQKVELSNMLGFVPSDTEVKVGAEWEREQNQNQGNMTIKYKEKFVITKIENNKIYVDSTIESSGVAAEFGEAEIKGKGTYVVAENFLPETFKYEMNVAMKDVDLGNGSKAEMKMDMNYDAVISKR